MQTKDSAQLILDGIAALDQQKREISDIVQLFRGTLRAIGGFDRRNDWSHLMHSPAAPYCWELRWRSIPQDLQVLCLTKDNEGNPSLLIMSVSSKNEHLPLNVDVAGVRRSLSVFTDGMLEFSAMLRSKLQPYIDAGS